MLLGGKLLAIAAQHVPVTLPWFLTARLALKVGIDVVTLRDGRFDGRAIAARAARWVLLALLHLAREAGLFVGAGLAIHWYDLFLLVWISAGGERKHESPCGLR